MNQQRSDNSRTPSLEEFEKLCEVTAQKWDALPRLSKIPLLPGSILSSSWTDDAYINKKQESNKFERIPIKIFLAAMPILTAFTFPVGLAFTVPASALALAMHQRAKDPVDDFGKIRAMLPGLRADFQEILKKAHETAKALALEPNAKELLEQTRNALEKFLDKTLIASPRKLKRYENGKLRGDYENRHYDQTALDLAISAIKELEIASSDPAGFARVNSVPDPARTQELGQQLDQTREPPAPPVVGR